MLKEVGASGQISLGKKYTGQLFDLQTLADGSIVMRPVKVVPLTHSVQEERADHKTSGATPASGDDRLTPERLAHRAAAVARDKWEAENKDAIEAFNARMQKIGSMGQRIHEWRKEKQSGAGQ